MPPEPKTTAAEIINTALELVRANGMTEITARNIGKKLGLSSRPIYSFYSSMEDLKKEVIREILKRYERALNAKKNSDVILGMGLGQVKFAREEPQFYTIVQDYLFQGNMKELLFQEPYHSAIRADACYADVPPDVLGDMLLKLKLFTNGLAEAVMHGALKDESDDAIFKLLSEAGDAITRYSLNK